MTSSSETPRIVENFRRLIFLQAFFILAVGELFFTVADLTEPVPWFKERRRKLADEIVRGGLDWYTRPIKQIIKHRLNLDNH